MSDVGFYDFDPSKDEGAARSSSSVLCCVYDLSYGIKVLTNLFHMFVGQFRT